MKNYQIREIICYYGDALRVSYYTAILWLLLFLYVYHGF